MKDIDLQQRRYVARMAQALEAGRIGRRDFFRAAALAGFGITSARYLTGCAGIATPHAERTGASTLPEEQQRFLAEAGRPFRGTKIRIVSEDTPPGLAIGRWIEPEFTALTGIEVEWEVVPLDQVLARTLEDTIAGARGDKGRCDVYYWDQAWLARFANDCIPVDELLAKRDLAYPGYDFDDFLPELVEKTASYGGRRVGVPFDIPIFIMMYRKDVFDELRLPVPSTMSEYMNVVRTIHQAMRGRGMYGTVGQWKSGHFSLQCDASAWMWSHGGHHFDAEGKPDYVTDANAQGLEYMMELGRYMDPAVTGWDWNGEGEAFRNGHAGVVISWGEFFPGFDDPAASKVAGLVEAADCPREAALLSPEECGYGETPGISRQGGSCLALSRHAPNRDAGWLFMQWATSADVIARANTQGANTPIRKSSFTDPRVLAMNKPGRGTTRHFAVTRRAIESRMGTSPRLPEWSALASDVNAEEYGKMTTGRQSVRATLEAIQRRTENALSS
jgi:multiple sugar transport system substrate-binding protein